MCGGGVDSTYMGCCLGIVKYVLRLNFVAVLVSVTLYLLQFSLLFSVLCLSLFY